MPVYPLLFCLMKTKVGLDWYQLIHFGKLSCRQVSFSGPKGPPSREENTLFKAFSQPVESINITTLD
jgi:hypothetical protein